MVRIGTVALALILASANLAFAQSEVADAAMRRDNAAVRSLVQEGANVNAAQADGATALHWAAYHGNAALAELLLEAGADASAANRNGSTPMWLAANQGNTTVIETLLSGGAGANEALPLGRRPLMLAARAGSVDAVRVLLEDGADPNAGEDERGTTALMQAADQGHADVMALLIEHGADVAARSIPVFRDRRTAALGKSEDPRNSVRRQVIALLCEHPSPDLSTLRELISESSEDEVLRDLAAGVDLTTEDICSKLERGALGFVVGRRNAPGEGARWR